MPPTVIAAYIQALPGMRHDLESVIRHFKSLGGDAELPRRRSREQQAWIVALCKARELVEDQVGRPFLSRHGPNDRRVRIYSMDNGDVP